MFCLGCIKVNEIVNKFLLAGDKFMPEMHLKQPGFTYTVCDPFTKNKKRIKKIVQTGNIYLEMSFVKLFLNMIWLMVNQHI